MFCNLNILDESSEERKPAESGNKSATGGKKSSRKKQPKSTDSGKQSLDKRLLKRQADSLTEDQTDRLTSDVEVPDGSSRSQRAKVTRVTQSSDVASAEPYGLEEEMEESESESEDGDQEESQPSLEEEEVLKVFAFLPEWLDASSTNCSPQIADAVVNLLRLLQDRQGEIDRLKHSLGIFGITELQWTKEGDPTFRPLPRPDPLKLKDTRPAKPRQALAVTTSKLERLPTKFTDADIRKFCDHLRSCHLGGMNDQRAELLSSTNFAMIGSIDEFQDYHEEWMKWDGPALADKLMRCYGGGNKVAVSTMDWRTVAEQSNRRALEELIHPVHPVGARASTRSRIQG